MELEKSYDITYCGFKHCPNTDCLRYHKNAPSNVYAHWFAVRPKPEGNHCEYYLKNKEEEK